MSVQRMQYEEKSGYLAGNQFIADLACKKLGLTLDQLEEIVGRYSKGKRKGELRGLLRWWKITEGGWHHEVGVVRNVGLTLGYRIEDYDGNVLAGWKFDFNTALTELKSVDKYEMKVEELPGTGSVFGIRVVLDYSKSGNLEKEIFEYKGVEVLDICTKHPDWAREVLQGKTYTEENDKRVLTVSCL